MYWRYLGLIVILKVLITTSEAASKDYTDLLQLRDNDNFLWGVQENGVAATKVQNQNSSVHFLSKRQAPAQDSTIQANKDFGPCMTPLGEKGRCRHLIYCRLPELKNDAWKLVSQLCVIEKSAIGICCPEGSAVSHAGPQIISDVNANGADDARIVNHAEQRGCGITTREFPRITGGRPAEPDEWPWMVAILQPRLPYVWCGGVLVTDRHVLTAAHCVYKIKNDQLFVRLGEYNTHEVNETRARDFRIATMVTHIDYDPLTYAHDIALLRLDRPTLFNTYIWPICMPPIGENWEGRTAVVTGWGTQSFGGPHSDILMEVSMPIWRHDDCQNAMVEHIPDSVLCAGLPTGGQDSCQGDSGGPLLLQLPNRRWVTIGIVSWGVRCGEANRPGMYTRVDKYLHWIIEHSDI